MSQEIYQCRRTLRPHTGRIHSEEPLALAEPVEGFEPPTPSLQVRCSGQLSYTGLITRP